MRKLYAITDRAGRHVAGYRRNPGQDEILLTDGEAEHPLRVGEIVHKEFPQPPAAPEAGPAAAPSKSRPSRRGRSTADA